MITNKLITRTEAREFKDFSKTLNDDVFNSILLQTQIEDLAPLLGEDLFNDLLENPLKYESLLNGGSYIINSKSYKNYGLKAVISYYIYARYTMFGNVKDTPFGQMVKIAGEGSAEPSQKAKDALYQSNLQTAFTIWQSVENYLIRTANVLFLQKPCYNVRSNNNLKIGMIR